MNTQALRKGITIVVSLAIVLLFSLQSSFAYALDSGDIPESLKTYIDEQAAVVLDESGEELDPSVLGVRTPTGGKGGCAVWCAAAIGCLSKESCTHGCYVSIDACDRLCVGPLSGQTNPCTDPGK